MEFAGLLRFITAGKAEQLQQIFYCFLFYLFSFLFAQHFVEYLVDFS